MARIHPLVAGASAAVIIASGVGIAAVTGYLPGSKAEKAESLPAKAPVKKQHVAAAAPAPHKAKCADCGVVVEVKEVEVKGEGSGVGAVAGGVVGAVVAHEIVDGRNQGIATVAGAAGGALAGHQIEKQVKAKKRYDVAVRMEDGSTRTVALAAAPALKSGDRVRVVGPNLEPLK